MPPAPGPDPAPVAPARPGRPTAPTNAAAPRVGAARRPACRLARAAPLLALAAAAAARAPESGPRAVAAPPLQQATATASRTVRPITPTPPPTPRPAPTIARPDVSIGAVRVVDAVHDPATLVISATFTAALANIGAVTAERWLEVTWFADANRTGAFEADADVLLATAVAPDHLAPGETEPMRAAGRATLPFRDAPVLAVVTIGGVLGEGDIANNVDSTASACEPAMGDPPAPDALGRALAHVSAAPRAPSAWATPQAKWRWPAPGQTPAAAHALPVEAAPIVLDLDRDGAAEVIFVTLDRTTEPDSGILRAVDGRTGVDRFAVDAPGWRVAAFSAPAAADLDGDGRPEIVAVDDASTGVVAFRADGAPYWRSGPVISADARRRLAGPSLADLDGDGWPEILVDDAVLDAGGQLVDRTVPGALAVDLDLIGLSGAEGPPRLEILGLGIALAPFDGPWRTPLWSYLGAADEVGFNAVANLDADPYAEIVIVGDNGDVQLLHHNGAPLGASRCYARDPSECRQFQGGQGGPPVIADFDGDGWADIGIAGRRHFAAWRVNGRPLWDVDTNDANSGRTSAVAFDFEGDGAAEVVYADLRHLRILDGVDGDERWSAERPSLTNFELPVVADIDGDARADIVVGHGGDGGDGGASPGLAAYGNPAWAPARPIWHQHAYRYGSIGDDARVPRRTVPEWQVHNGFRDATLPGGPPVGRPDLTLGRPVLDRSAPAGTRRLVVRLGNAGRAAAGRAVDVVAFDGPVGGTRLATATLAAALPAGGYVDVALAVPAGVGSRPVTIVADPDGRVAECSGWRPAGAPADPRANNHLALDLAALPSVPPTATPTASRTAARTASPTPTPSPTLEPWRTPLPTPSPTASATLSATPTPTATPSDTPGSGSATPSATPTAVPSPTADASPSAAPSASPPAPRPARAYLPAALSARCADGRPVDAVVVLDASAHMAERDGAGTRFDLARAAAGAVLGALEAGGAHRAALVTAGDGARLRTPLGPPADAARALAALDPEAARSAATPIDAALQLAASVASGARPSAAAAIVVVSDGRAWPTELAAAEAAARAAEAGGAVVLAIGVGDRTAPVRPVLRALVGDAARVLDTRTGREAGAWVVAGARCPPGPWWMGR